MNPDAQKPEAEQAVELDLSVYSRKAITQAAYAFTGRCYVSIAKLDEKTAKVRLLPKAECSDIQELGREFLNELLDHQLRAQLWEEFGEIQRMVVSEAFAPLERPEDHG